MSGQSGTTKLRQSAVDAGAFRDYVIGLRAETGIYLGRCRLTTSRRSLNGKGFPEDSLCDQ